MRRYVGFAVLWLILCTDAIADPFIFAAAPMANVQASDSMHIPIATYLTQSTGHEFVYKRSADWASYLRDMRQDRYDLVFDGPQFISWRTEHLHHTPLARLPGSLDFVVVARRDNQKVAQLLDLAGYPVCSRQPPLVDTLVLQAQFGNPYRQPVLTLTDGHGEAYSGLLEGRCLAAILPIRSYSGHVNRTTTRILFQSRPLPQYGFSASRRLPSALQTQIAKALLDVGGATVTRALRELHFQADPLVPTNRGEYANIHRLLVDTWGFGAIVR